MPKLWVLVHTQTYPKINTKYQAYSNQSLNKHWTGERTMWIHKKHSQWLIVEAINDTEKTHNQHQQWSITPIKYMSNIYDSQFHNQLQDELRGKLYVNHDRHGEQTPICVDPKHDNHHHIFWLI